MFNFFDDCSLLDEDEFALFGCNGVDDGSFGFSDSHAAEYSVGFKDFCRQCEAHAGER